MQTLVSPPEYLAPTHETHLSSFTFFFPPLLYFFLSSRVTVVLGTKIVRI
jgi:hypothetical protein